MIVDTSPVLTPLNVAILYAVAELLIPIDPCIAALAGVRALEDLIKSVSEFRLEFTDAGPLTVAGVLITRADRTWYPSKSSPKCEPTSDPWFTNELCRDQSSSAKLTRAELH